MQLPGTLTFDYPSISSLAAYLHEQLTAVAAAAGSAITHSSTALPLVRVPETAMARHSSAEALVTVDTTTARLSGPGVTSTEDSCQLVPYR